MCQNLTAVPLDGPAHEGPNDAGAVREISAFRTRPPVVPARTDDAGTNHQEDRQHV